jgi:hypothetical protein
MLCDNAAAFYRPNSIGNPDLKMGKFCHFNTGLDFSTSGRDRVLGSFVTNTSDLAKRHSHCQNSTGFGGFITNIGETQNRIVSNFPLSALNIERWFRVVN